MLVAMNTVEDPKIPHMMKCMKLKSIVSLVRVFLYVSLFVNSSMCMVTLSCGATLTSVVVPNENAIKRRNMVICSFIAEISCLAVGACSLVAGVSVGE